MIMFTSIILAGLTAVIFSACSEGTPQLLTERQLVGLQLHQTMNIDEKSLKRDLPDFFIEAFEWYQDGPTTQGFKAIQNQETWILFKAKDHDRSSLDYLMIKNPAIYDEYGIKVGRHFHEIKQARPALKLMTNTHFHSYAYVEGSRIRYELKNSSKHKGPDRDNYSEEEVADWPVIALIWQSDK